MNELELVAPTTDQGNRAADEGVRVGSPGLETGEIGARTTNSPSAVEGPAGATAMASAGPYDPAELEALVEAVWSLEEDDPTRFDELLHAALVMLGRIAMTRSSLYSPSSALDRQRVTQLLRSMEQRALWGPDHPVRQP